MQILISEEDVFRHLHQHCTPTLLNNGCSQSACSDIYTGLLFQFKEDHLLHDPHYSQEEVDKLTGRALQLWDQVRAFECTDADLEILLLARSTDLGERVKDILLHHCLPDAERIVTGMGGTQLLADLALQYAVNRLVERYMKGENLIREKRVRSLKGYMLGVVRKKFPEMAEKYRVLEPEVMEAKLPTDESSARDRFFEPETQTEQELVIERMGLIFEEAFSKLSPKDRELLELWARGVDWFDIAVHFSKDQVVLLQNRRRLEEQKNKLQEQIIQWVTTLPEWKVAPADLAEFEELRKTIRPKKDSGPSQSHEQKKRLAASYPILGKLLEAEMELQQIKNDLGNLSAAIRKKGNRKKTELMDHIFAGMLDDPELDLPEETRQLIALLREKAAEGLIPQILFPGYFAKDQATQDALKKKLKEQISDLRNIIKLIFNLDKSARHEP